MPHRWCVLCVSDIDKRIPLNATSHFQLTTIESLHTRHYIHRDIKPANFMILADSPSPISFLIDFGLAQQFRNPATYLHTPYSPHNPIVGTLPFTSIIGQQGGTQSRRDDLESLAYTIIYSACGKLPWTGCRSTKAVLQKKLGVPIEELCQGLPTPFRDFITYVHSLGFNKKPDYQHLHSILLLCSETASNDSNQPIKARPSVHIPVSAKHKHTPVVSDHT